MNAVVSFQPQTLALLRRTIASSLNLDEFDLFLSMAQRHQLDPVKREIVPVVFNADKEDKRSMVPIVTRNGLRVIAARLGNYRAASEAPLIEYSEDAKDPASNPLGIVRAQVTLWQRHGDDWFPVVGEAYWDEYAPLETIWEDDPERHGRRRPTDRKKLSGTWLKMPRVMLPKVAEVAALRAGWPDAMGGLYIEDEMEKAIVADRASEVLAQYQEEARIRRVGAESTIVFSFSPDGVLEAIPRGQIADRLFSFVKECESKEALASFRDRNAAGLKQFWAVEKADALELRSFMDQRTLILEEQEKENP